MKISELNLGDVIAIKLNHGHWEIEHVLRPIWEEDGLLLAYDHDGELFYVYEGDFDAVVFLEREKEA